VKPKICAREASGREVLIVALILVWLGGLEVTGQSRDEATVWAVPAVQKVRPEDQPETDNLVWSAAGKTISIAGAGNEHVPFQIVVSTPPPPTRYDKPAGGFFVSVGDLASENGRIDRSNIRVFVEHVVLCYAKSSPVGGTGFWPDALAPLREPFGMGAEFREAVRNRAVWIDVLVPADTRSGIYRGSVTITRDGAPLEELALQLQVYDFSLPRERHLITHMGISDESIARHTGLRRDSPEFRRLLRRYYDFLYLNRMEPWFHSPLQPRIERSAAGEVVVHFDESEYRYYLDELNTRRVILEAGPGELLRELPDEPFSAAWTATVASYLGQIYRYYQSHGWKDRLVLNSPIDEPNTAEHYAETRRWAELVHEAAPGIPFLVTESPVPDQPEWGTLVGYANNFSVHGNSLNHPDVKEALRREQAKGGEITWYISCDQVYPQPNYFIDAPALDPVMIPWITWRYGMSGILYWSINFWPQTPDPWIDAVTFLSGFLCSEGYVLNGEGSLIYPGNRTRRHTGQPDVEGPVSSIRLELLREGIEDYEYLWLLKSLGDGSFADRLVTEMVVDVSAFSRNPAELLAARRKMAARIEELTRGRGTTRNSSSGEHE
jgi:hypothetical protein